MSGLLLRIIRWQTANNVSIDLTVIVVHVIIKVDTQRQGHVCDIIFRKISIFVLLGLTIFVPFASITARAFLHMTMMARNDSILRKEGGCVCV